MNYSAGRKWKCQKGRKIPIGHVAHRYIHSPSEKQLLGKGIRDHLWS